MEEVSNWDVFWGHYNMMTYVSSVFWATLGAVFIKNYFFDRDKAKYQSIWTTMKFWMNDNARNIFNVVVLTVVIVRLGDVAIHIFEKYSGQILPEIDDFVIVPMVIAGWMQWWRHKHRKPISNIVAAQMHIHNEFCEHDKKIME